MSQPQIPTAGPAGRTDTMRGILWMLGAVAGLAGVVIAVRALKPEFHTLELLFLRSLIGLTVITAIALPRGWRNLMTKRPGLHLVRNMVHIGAQYCVFFAIIAIPLAEITSIEFTIPAMTAGIAALFLGERVSRHRWIGMGVSFIGAMFIVRPGFVDVPPAMLFVIAGAALFSVNNILVKLLTRTDSATTIVFTMNAIQAALLAGPALYFWSTPEWRHAPWILQLGLSGMAVHYCMSRALTLADTSVLFPLDFLRLPFIAAIAWALWGETFSPWTAMGATIIIASSAYAIRREARAEK